MQSLYTNLRLKPHWSAQRIIQKLWADLKKENPNARLKTEHLQALLIFSDPKLKKYYDLKFLKNQRLNPRVQGFLDLRLQQCADLTPESRPKYSDFQSSKLLIAHELELILGALALEAFFFRLSYRDHKNREIPIDQRPSRAIAFIHFAFVYGLGIGLTYLDLRFIAFPILVFLVRFRLRFRKQRLVYSRDILRQSLNLAPLPDDHGN